MSELLLLIKSILYQPMIGMDFTKYEPGIFPSFLIARLERFGCTNLRGVAISCL
jgi:hypothetical protein